MNLSIAEPGAEDRAAFDDNVTSTGGTIPNILKQKSQRDTIISSDGKRMTVNVALVPGRDGISKGKVGTITLSVRASYVDQYDSTTNKMLVPKTVPRDIRISLVNNAPNPFLKKTN